MRIGIDLDDVLVNFMGEFNRIATATYNRPFEPPVDWAWSNFDLSPENIDRLWDYIRGTYNFWEELDKESGASTLLINMLDRKHELFFITARINTAGNTVKNQSANWLNRYGVTNPVVLVEKDKGPLAAALKLDAFIDDRDKNVLEIKAVLPYCQVFIKDSSHNQHFSSSVIPRVKDFNEFARKFL